MKRWNWPPMEAVAQIRWHLNVPLFTLIWTIENIRASTYYHLFSANLIQQLKRLVVVPDASPQISTRERSQSLGSYSQVRLMVISICFCSENFCLSPHQRGRLCLAVDRIRVTKWIIQTRGNFRMRKVPPLLLLSKSFGRPLCPLLPSPPPPPSPLYLSPLLPFSPLLPPPPQAVRAQ